jgi:hypothetical protein
VQIKPRRNRGRGGSHRVGVLLDYEPEVGDALTCGPGVAVKQREWAATVERSRLAAG